MDEKQKVQDNQNSAQEDNVSFLMFMAVACGIMVAAFSAGYFVLAHPDNQEWLKVAGAAWVVLMIISIIMGFADQCPSCNRLGTATETSKHQISSNLARKTVTREQKNSKGDVISRWNEQIVVKQVKYRHDKECSACKHKWYTTSTAEYENFDE